MEVLLYINRTRARNWRKESLSNTMSGKSFSKPNKNVRRSYGIACCRHNDDGHLEMLLIKKRYTYNFVAFVFGQYDKKDTKRLKFLFDGMTRQEKIDITSRRFDYMWYKIWLEFPEVKYQPLDFKSSAKTINDSLIALKDKASSNFINCNSKVVSKLEYYLRKKNKFEQAFMLDDGKKIEHLMQGTTNAELTWEVPKGRRKKSEAEMDCAIREFEEETGLGIDTYNIMFNIKSVIDSFVAMNIKYVHSYYIGYTTSDAQPDQLFEYNNQLTEIDAVKWVSFDELKFIDPNGRLTTMVKRMFDIFKSKYKKIKP
jgi:8-oxo-dGTP pyrophosphatase MutT (NUDIX family)